MADDYLGLALAGLENAFPVNTSYWSPGHTQKHFAHGQGLSFELCLESLEVDCGNCRDLITGCVIIINLIDLALSLLACIQAKTKYLYLGQQTKRVCKL